MTKKTIRALFLLLVVLTLSGCRSEELTVRASELLFDTIVTIDLYGTDDTDLIDECFALGKYYENMFSKTIGDSEISQINASGGAPVQVSDETVFLLKKGIYYGELTGGTFDITISGAAGLWDFKQETPVLPDAGLLAERVRSIDYRSITITSNTVTLTDPNAEIDLGGIAKGYIADKMKEYLLEKDVSSAVLNLGGDVLTIGSKPDNTKWNIGVQKPFDEQNQVIASASVCDMAVVSSGSYERYFYYEDQLYHHILDPDTGYPTNNSLASVTIISETAVDGDCISTACFTLGLEEGLKLVNNLNNVEALFITSDETLHYSDGMDKYIKISN